MHGGTEAGEYLGRARAALAARDFAAAQASLHRALELDPGLSEAYELLGKLLYRDRRAAEAAALYRRWLRAVPSHPVAAHLVAATGGAPQPVRATDDFVKSLYARAAPAFDETAAALGYRAPELLLERATEALGAGWSGAQVLDLGCGTGLCGALLRSHARRLVGVDLSPPMLERARQRGCYDELGCVEVTRYLASHQGCFDLIAAADVFCYFGDLAAAFAAVARALRPGAYFVCSVEELEQPSGTHPRLLEHGRYAHSEAHVRDVLASASLQLVELRRDMLRFERGAPVQGLLVASRAAPVPLP